MDAEFVVTRERNVSLRIVKAFQKDMMEMSLSLDADMCRERTYGGTDSKTVRDFVKSKYVVSGSGSKVENYVEEESFIPVSKEA